MSEHPEALFFIGHECLQGKASGSTGLTQGVSRAMEYFLRAASKGHADALCSAGAMYYNGLGVPQVRHSPADPSYHTLRACAHFGG